MGALTLTGDKLVVAIRTEHEAASAAARSALEHALECGRLLAQARAEVPHGSWEHYLSDACGIAPRTGRLYLRLHAHRDRLENRQRVAGLTVREAAKLVAEPRPQVEAVRRNPPCDDPTKAEHWVPKITAAWDEAIEAKQALVDRIAEILATEQMSPGDRRHGERMLAESAAELALMQAEQAKSTRAMAPRWYLEGQKHEGVHSAGWLVEVWPHPGGPQWVHFAVAVPGVDGPSHLEGPKRGCRVDRLAQVMSRVYHLPDVDGPGWDWNVRPVDEHEAELVEAHYNARLYTCANEYAELELR